MDCTRLTIELLIAILFMVYMISSTIVVESFGGPWSIVLDVRVYYSHSREPVNGAYIVLSRTPYKTSINGILVGKTDEDGHLLVNETITSYSRVIYMCLFLPNPYNTSVDLAPGMKTRNCIELYLESRDKPNIYNYTIILEDYGVKTGYIVIEDVIDEYNVSIYSYRVRVTYNGVVIRDVKGYKNMFIEGLGSPPLIASYRDDYGEHKLEYNIEFYVNNTLVHSEKTSIPATISVRVDLHKPHILDYNVTCILKKVDSFWRMMHLNVMLEYSDGVYTDNVDVDVKIAIDGRDKVPVITSVNSGLVNISTTISSKKLIDEIMSGNKSISISIVLTDWYGRKTLFSYNLSSRDIKVVYIRANETRVSRSSGLVSRMYNRSYSTINNYSISGELFTPENKPVSITQSSTRNTLLEYSIPVIAVATILLEIKRRRGL